jgi:enamine deaminase RidA (YjgF/YER057c/UK114 family)
VTSTFLLNEEDFSIEYLTCVDTGLSWDENLKRAIGNSGCVVQERIIASEAELGVVLNSLHNRNDPCRYAAPSLWISRLPGPIQRAAVVVKPRSTHVNIERFAGGFILTTDELRILFGEPAHQDDSVANGFYSSFMKVSETLDASGMHETDIIRTWLFLNNMQGDYELLNQARRDYFDRKLVGSGVALPASTGIQGTPHPNSRFTVEFWAISGANIQVERFRSPLQCEPTNYGVLFSRTLQVKFPKNELLLISGTASISATGNTLYVEDCGAQMKYTLKVIEALLNMKGGDFNNIVQGTIYVKREEHVALCLEIARQAGFPCARSIIRVADICRESLLCEIEAQAIFECASINARQRLL